MRGIAHRAERVGKVRDDEAPAVPEERQDVVAQLEVAPRADVVIGEADELLAFLAVDGIESRPCRRRLPRLHLGDDERPAAARDEIDLAVARADVAPDDAVPAQTIEPRRAALAAPSQLARVEALTSDGSASRCRCA